MKKTLIALAVAGAMTAPMIAQVEAENKVKPEAESVYNCSEGKRKMRRQK